MKALPILFLAFTLSASAGEIIRDKYGRIARSKEAVREFKMQHPCPANGLRFGRCPGYVVDHIQPLACHGPDIPNNMQWQSIDDAKAKDKWERIGC